MGGVLCFSQISFQSAHGVGSRIDLAFVSVTERFPGAEPQGSGPRQEPSFNSACKRTQHSDRSEHQSPRSPIYFDFAMGSAMYSRKRPNRGSNGNESVIGQKNVQGNVCYDKPVFSGSACLTSTKKCNIQRDLMCWFLQRRARRSENDVNLISA